MEKIAAGTASNASVNKKGKNVKSDADSASAISDRDKIQSQLDRQLQQRPSATDLKNRNILKDTTASPALQAAQNELQRLQLGSALDKKLSQRPEAATLVKQNILQADPSHGTVTKKPDATKSSANKVAAITAENASTATKSATNTKKTAAIKKQDAHDPKNLQLVAHDPKDYQLVAHDPKDYRVAIRDEKQMQLIVSPKAATASFSNGSSSHGNDDGFSFSKGVMIDPRTGSPMSHAAMRKHKKLMKLRDSMIDHQNSHIAVPVSNAGILYDPMQSHKMNALVKVASKTEKSAAPVKSVTSHSEEKQNKQQQKSTATVHASHSNASTAKAAATVVPVKSTASVRSTSPVATTARSVSPAPAQQQAAINLKSQQSSKTVAASPQQQSLKMAPSPVLSAKSSAVSIKARA